MTTSTTPTAPASPAASAAGATPSSGGSTTGSGSPSGGPAATTATPKAKRPSGRLVALVMCGLVMGLGLWLFATAVYESHVYPYDSTTILALMLFGLAIALAGSKHSNWWAVVVAVVALVVLLLGGLLGTMFGNLSLGANPLWWVLSFGVFVAIVLGAWWFVKKHILN